MPSAMRNSDKQYDTVTANIFSASLQIHRDLGPGLLESVYEAILERELLDRGFHVQRQQRVNITYRGHQYTEAFRADLVVENWVVVEVKSIARISAADTKQLLSYLKLLGLPVGLLVNFGCATLREGLKRMVHTPRPQEQRLSASAAQEGVTRAVHAP